MTGRHLLNHYPTTPAATSPTPRTLMIMITESSIPVDQFALGRLFADASEIAIDLERLIPLQEGVIVLFWIEGAPSEEVEHTIREDPFSDAVQQLTEVNGRTLFEVRCTPAHTTFIQSLFESRAEVLRAEETMDRWEFCLQFRNRTQLAAFRESCQANDLQLQVTALYNPVVPTEDHPGSPPAE